MKKALTADQVTENLKRLFEGKEIECIEAWETWQGVREFIIKTNISTVFVTGKRVWMKPTVRGWFNYMVYCRDFGAMYEKIKVKGATFIPFIFIKRRKKNTFEKEETVYDQAEKLFLACGIKREKKEQTPEQRLRELKLSHYADFYKVLSGLKILSACFIFETMTDLNKSWNVTDEKLFCRVEAETGNYRFAIEHNEPEIAAEIRTIFRTLLNVPVTLTRKEKQAAA